MSQENVEAFKRGLEAGNRGDVETLLEVLDPEVAWHSALHALMGGEATVFRGHDGVREMLRDLYEAFDEIHIEISEIRDLGDRLVAIGHSRTRGKASGAETESPLALVTEVKNGKTISIRGYLDPKEALEAAGLSEQWRELTRYRMHLVKHRSTLKHPIHAALMSFGRPCPVTDLFGVEGRRLLDRLEVPEPWRSNVFASLELMDELDRKIVDCNARLEVGHADHPYVPLLRSVPGIGKVLAFTIASEIGDISRFPRPSA